MFPIFILFRLKNKLSFVIKSQINSIAQKKFIVCTASKTKHRVLMYQSVKILIFVWRVSLNRYTSQVAEVCEGTSTISVI